MTEPAAFQRPGIQRVQLVDVNGNAIGSAAAPSSTIVQGVDGVGPATLANPFPVRAGLLGADGATLASASNPVPAIVKAYTPTYTYFIEGFAPDIATATANQPLDIAILKGSATKIVRVVAAIVRWAETAAALRTLYFIRRSADNTAGTRAAQTALKRDTADPAATAAFYLYSVKPSALGAAVGTEAKCIVSTTLVATAVPAVFGLSSFSTGGQDYLRNEPITLRGVSEYLAINMPTAGAGAACQIELQITESDT